MKNIKQLMIAMALVVGAMGLVAPTAVGAVNVFTPCENLTATDSAVCASKADAAPPLVKTIVNTLLYIVGVIAVIVIIIGGLMYTTSAGDTAGVTKAKNTILYAVIGLVVALLAYAIVNWVLFNVTKP